MSCLGGCTVAVRSGDVSGRRGPNGDQRFAADLASHEPTRFVELLEPSHPHTHEREKMRSISSLKTEGSV